MGIKILHLIYVLRVFHINSRNKNTVYNFEKYHVQNFKNMPLGTINMNIGFKQHGSITLLLRNQNGKCEST